MESGVGASEDFAQLGDHGWFTGGDVGHFTWGARWESASLSGDVLAIAHTGVVRSDRHRYIEASVR
jgi:hypothetical protein